jgi:hypothetical protein
MKADITRALAILFLLAVPLGAQTLDQYGGVIGGSCANPNGNKYFGLARVNGRLMFCDPLGHPFFARGFYVFTNTTQGNDETGHNYDDYTSAKFSGLSSQAILDIEIGRFQSWGFNSLGPDASAYAMPVQPYTGEDNPTKVPFITGEDACYYSRSNLHGWGTAPVKDLKGVSSTYAPAWTSVTDYEDPAFVAYLNGQLKNDGAITGIVNATALQKSYFLGFDSCDSDYTHGFGAGPDFDTRPEIGNNDFRLSFVVALASPVEWASDIQDQIYTDATFYSKKAFYTQLTAKYANIAALNTAWGSSYTTFGTSGTCYGSSLPSWLCPSRGVAAAIGTGNGSNLNFTGTLNTIVSANSVGIFVAGTLVGGDNGNGTIYGPNLSGSITYSSGALTLTFASGYAPADGTAVTAQYIANGWGLGTGAMDEDGRSSHQSWTGHNEICIDGVGTTAACVSAGGGPPYASAGMVTDLNNLDIEIAGHFASTYRSAIDTYFPGLPFLGVTTLGSWSNPPNRYVLQGMAPYTTVMQIGSMALTQDELDFIHQYAGDMPLIAPLYNTANADSPFAWPNSSCSHSGTEVTCTLATPQYFDTGSLIVTDCMEATYNVSNIRPDSSSGSTLTYTAGGTPTNPTTTCNVYFYDGSYTRQSARATAVGNQLAALATQAYTADGVQPWVGAFWWQWSDVPRERESWGLVTTRDNAYNGVETTTSAISCSPPLQAYSCGGELRSGWGSDDGITPLVNANKAIDKALAAQTAPLPPTGLTAVAH